jgi:hypothetical protein
LFVTRYFKSTHCRINIPCVLQGTKLANPAATLQAKANETLHGLAALALQPLFRAGIAQRFAIGRIPRAERVPMVAHALELTRSKADFARVRRVVHAAEKATE